MESKEKNWITTDKRFIVFLDIMVFKDFVARNSHEHVYDIMTKLSKARELIDSFNVDQFGTNFSDKGLYTTSFSDSIILFSKDNSISSFELITAATEFLMSEAMKDAIPMKGSIAYGTISVNKAKQIYFGQPLIDAYLLQEEVNYYGVVAHNSIDAFITENINYFDQELKDSYKEIKTPLKSGMINHRNILWFKALLELNEDESVISIRFAEILNKLKSITSGAPRKYIDNTEDVFRKVSYTSSTNQAT